MSAAPLEIIVLGIAAPKGSAKGFFHKHTGRVIVTHDSKRTRPWSESVMHAALDALGGRPPLEGPSTLDVTFYLPRPATLPKRVLVPAKKRDDVDKLLRCLADAIVRAGVVVDDGHITDWSGVKRFAGGVGDPPDARHHGLPRAVIVVAPLVLPTAPAAPRQLAIGGA